jgi:hypothetical protein
MRKPIATALAIAIALAGCKQKVDDSATNAAMPQAATTEPATATPPTARKLPRFASPARIAEIKASGKTGFWIDAPEFCPGHRVGVLTWNVESSGAEKVVVYVVGKDGKEQNFGRGGPVGERQTGEWLKPGLVFRLRNAAGGAELGSITIERGKSC